MSKTTPGAENSLSREEKLIRGTAWSTFSDFAGRLLGAFYVIPWYIWMGDVAPQANALYGMGYNVYQNFLILSTVGINAAVAKQIAKYNALDQEATGLKLARDFIKLMSLTGLVSAVLLYTGAPSFARASGAGADLTQVIRSLTLAVLLFPVMSVLRGIFQGYNNIKPSALSQLAEQLVRVIWMLLTVFLIMKIGSRDYVGAVIQSTFAAFVGMLASMAVLIYSLWKDGILGKLLKPQSDQVDLNSRALMWETAKAGIPLLITGWAISAYQTVDQLTFINVMSKVTNHSLDQLNVMYAYLSANPAKITMIIVSVAASLGGVSLALLTESFLQEDHRGTARLILNNFQMLLVFLMPALMGAILLAAPLYNMFYGPSEPLAIGLFVAMLVQVFLQSLYMMLSPMLHAIFESRKAVLFFVYGLLVKLVTQLPSIYLFKAYGPILSTGLALLVSVVLIYRHLQAVTKFNTQIIYRNSVLILMLTAIMVLPVTLVAAGLTQVLPPTTRVNSVIYLVLCGSIGVAVYGYLSLKTRSVDKLLGTKADRLRQRLTIK